MKVEIYRLNELFDPNYIISPSYEAIIPDLFIENVIVLAEAAIEQTQI